MPKHVYPLGGWLAPGQPFTWQREDHGQDLAIGGDHVLHAPGEGVCVAILSDAAFPNGFGPHYPVLRIDTGRWAGKEWSLGHTTALVAVDQHFPFQHPVAVADQSGRVSGWPAGWVELGEARNGGPLHDNPPHWYKHLFADLTVRVPDKPLHRGNQGPKVLMFTGRLAKLGLLPRRYWHFTTKVAGAVKLFQKQHHLRESGLVDGQTWVAIKQAAHKKGR